MRTWEGPCFFAITIKNEKLSIVGARVRPYEIYARFSVAR